MNTRAPFQASVDAKVLSDDEEILGEPGTTAYPTPTDGWVCFHCGVRFKGQGAARRHFGNTPDGLTRCQDMQVKNAALQSRLALAEAAGSVFRDGLQTLADQYVPSTVGVPDERMAEVLAIQSVKRNFSAFANKILANSSTAAQALLAEQDELKQMVATLKRGLDLQGIAFSGLSAGLEKRAETAERERDQLKATQRPPGTISVCERYVFHDCVNHYGHIQWKHGSKACTYGTCPRHKDASK